MADLPAERALIERAKAQWPEHRREHFTYRVVGGKFVLATPKDARLREWDDLFGWHYNYRPWK